MARIILSADAPSPAPNSFGFGQFPSFTPPFETDNGELLAEAAAHPFLDVEDTAAPVVEPVTADDPYVAYDEEN